MKTRSYNHPSQYRLSPLAVVIPLVTLFASVPAFADHPDVEDGTHHESFTEGAQVVEYPASFFERYQPNTALDMVNQVPGFNLDNNEDMRGFAAVAGNVLINNRRPNVKQDSPAGILGRIPAANVVRIDLIRGQTSSVDMRGEAVVVNVILREDTRSAVRWESYLWKNSESGTYMPGGAVSLSSRWNSVDYTAGVDGNRHVHPSVGTRNSYDASGDLSEDRAEHVINTHFLIDFNLNASTTIGETLFHASTELGYDTIEEIQTAIRTPQIPGGTPRTEIVIDDRDSDDQELTLTAERSLTEDLLGKGILIYNQSNFNEISTQEILNSSNQRTLYRISDTGTDTQEFILRSEFDWSGIESHAIQLNMEGAFNALEGTLFQTVDTGSGPVIEEVIGANTRVEEVRGDFLLADTWSIGSVQFNYGLGAEVSRLTQTGDAELERNFFFLKPQSTLIYSGMQDSQTRVRIAREVSQLDFNDFVTATVFQDNDTILGNPNLRPETTWIADLVHERRYGDIGVVKIRFYHHWISNVEDLLPITTTAEAPGNIGSGKRRGVELVTTVPMGWVGLDNARLDFKGRWQHSSVTDPVTGDKRQLSSEGRVSAQIPYNDIDLDYIVAVDFRQDFTAERMAWGWEVRERADRPLYKVNELDVYNEGTELNLFVETTRWLGIKMNFRIKDILDQAKVRNRRIFTGERGLSAIDRDEITDLSRGRQFELLLSGSF